MSKDLTITVGLLYRGPVRRFLAEAEWSREIVEWKEIKGWLDSRFLVRGASDRVIRQIDAWINDVSAQVVSN